MAEQCNKGGLKYEKVSHNTIMPYGEIRGFIATK